MAKHKILITGGAGYIGSVITEQFLSSGNKVVALDSLWFNKGIPFLFKDNPNYKFVKGSILDSEILDKIMSSGIDYLVHTAAVVGEPASNKFPDLTEEINYRGAINVINKSLQYNLKGFIFFSTCSNYGIADGIAKEDSSLNPLSLYARTKVNVEHYLMDKAKGLDWVICRLATVYGLSPRMRFDLTVNDFVSNAYIKKYIDIFLPYTHRPYIHVRDVAKVIQGIIDNFKNSKGEIFNVGFNGQNYQKIQIANIVKIFIPELKIEIVKSGSDARDYQVDFSKLQRLVGIKNDFMLEDGVREILELLKSGKVDPQQSCYYNTNPVWE